VSYKPTLRQTGNYIAAKEMAAQHDSIGQMQNA